GAGQHDQLICPLTLVAQGRKNTETQIGADPKGQDHSDLPAVGKPAAYHSHQSFLWWRELENVLVGSDPTRLAASDRFKNPWILADRRLELSIRNIPIPVLVCLAEDKLGELRRIMGVVQLAFFRETGPDHRAHFPAGEQVVPVEIMDAEGEAQLVRSA